MMIKSHALQILGTFLFCLIAFLLVKCGTSNVAFFTEKSDPSRVESNSEDEIFSYGLPVSGDYSKLNFTFVANKKKYKIGEPIFFRRCIKNDSETPINIDTKSLYPIFAAYSVEVVDSKGKPVLKTAYGEERARIDRIGSQYNALYAPTCMKLGPCEKTMSEDNSVLSVFYDFSKPGTYKIKLFLHTILYNKKFDPPLESNEVMIEILSGSSIKPSDLREFSDIENFFHDDDKKME